jgi:hypothetical protein
MTVMGCTVYKEPALFHPGIPFARQESECTVEEPKQCPHDKINGKKPNARPRTKRSRHSTGQVKDQASKRRRAEGFNAFVASNKNTYEPAEHQNDRLEKYVGKMPKAEGRVGCPFRKHDPSSHQQYHGCGGKGFQDMAKLK